MQESYTSRKRKYQHFIPYHCHLKGNFMITRKLYQPVCTQWTLTCVFIHLSTINDAYFHQTHAAHQIYEAHWNWSERASNRIKLMKDFLSPTYHLDYLFTTKIFVFFLLVRLNEKAHHSYARNMLVSKTTKVRWVIPLGMGQVQKLHQRFQDKH